MIKTVLLLCLLAGGWIVLAAQSSSQPTPSPATPAATAPPATAPPPARPGDVDTLEHIVLAVYDVISGPAGPRDWDRFRSLYYPGARMIPSGRNDKGTGFARVTTPDEYASRSQDYFTKQGFFEGPVANRVEVWDHIAHVWSTYESRHAKEEKPFARGINSFQLFNDGSRWWILTVYWEGEDKDHPLPEKYMK